MNKQKTINDEIDNLFQWALENNKSVKIEMGFWEVIEMEVLED